jgi:TolA-binding protein
MMRKRTTGRTFVLKTAAYALTALLIASQWAAAVQGTIVTTARARLKGEIRWLGASRAYEISDGNIGKQVSLSQVSRIIVPKPAGLDKAAQMVAAGQHAQAVPALKNIIEKYQMLEWDIPASRWLAEAYLNLGKVSEAEDMCNKVFRQNPAAKTSGDLAGVYWDVLLKAGKQAKLNMVLKDAIKEGGREVAAVAQVKRADMAKAKGDVKDALIDGYLRTAILFRDVKSIQPEALFKAGQCLQQLGQASHAEKMRKRLLDQYPTSKYAAQLRAGA